MGDTLAGALLADSRAYSAARDLARDPSHGPSHRREICDDAPGLRVEQFPDQTLKPIGRRLSEFRRDGHLEAFKSATVAEADRDAGTSYCSTFAQGRQYVCMPI